MQDAQLEQLARETGLLLLEKGLSMTAAESCTGGWIAKLLTDIPGSSGWFERGFVTYSNASKTELLGVREDTLALFGAVSEQVALQMARGALSNSRADPERRGDRYRRSGWWICIQARWDGVDCLGER